LNPFPVTIRYKWRSVWSPGDRNTANFDEETTGVFIGLLVKFSVFRGRISFFPKKGTV